MTTTQQRLQDNHRYEFLSRQKLWPLKRPIVSIGRSGNLSTLSTDTASQLDVLGHDGDPLGVDGAQVGVLEETHEVSLTGLLQGHNSRALEPQVSLEVLGNLPDQTLEGELTDEKLGGLLVPPDLPKGHSARPVPVGLLDSPGGWGRFTCSLGGQLFPGGFASGGFPGSLLSASHDVVQRILILRVTIARII